MPRRPRILITAGPTRAYLDEVRFLTNYATGRLGFELARLLKEEGAQVHVVSGPTQLDWKALRVSRLSLVETNDEMHQAVLASCRSFRPDAAVFSAAVLDFAPHRARSGKVSSRSGWTLHLKPTPKIVDDVGKKFPKLKRVGFKLEAKRPRSKKEIEAQGKKLLIRKGYDGLVLNYYSDLKKGQIAYLFGAQGEMIERRSKGSIAKGLAKSLLRELG